MTDDDKSVLNDEERETMLLLDAVIGRIYDWGLRGNQLELIQATHVIQGFIIQHMLQRLSPEWAKWYAQRDDEDKPRVELVEEPTKTA